jgi:prepilin-type N-terminal cleavage/methylation domain-containing protein
MIIKTARARKRGFTMIEALIASALIALSMLALGQLWTFAARVTTDTDDRGIAYSLARLAIETVRETGFTNTAEGSTTVYYDINQNTVLSTAPTRRYMVVTTVTSSATVPGSSPVQPSTDALRTVVVTVTLVPTNTVIFTTGTYMASSGI